jgi:hypothetical protein
MDMDLCSNAPTNCDVDTTDANIIIYKNQTNMVKTWNKMTDDIIAKNANEIWGTRNWTISPTKQIEELSAMCSKVGTASVLTIIGKKKFMECWKSTILSYQVMELLTPKAQATIKIQDHAYQWIDPMSDKIMEDGCMLLNEALKLMHPDVQTNVHAKLTKIKAIKPVDHAYNIVK